MALNEYRRKRDFKSTPEPAGAVNKTSKNRFVIQKHRASHLHFDFRLEMDGVLKSWAVPKGPTLDPTQKRLAMQVEDHPVSYFDFEGIIPPGNYGAGTVMVWDMGTWEPLGDPSAMLAKGDLKFRLSGKKLNGEFVLARMKSRRPGSKGTEWLLIKKRDEFAKEGFDANSPEYEYSVLTGRSLEEIARDAGSAEWESNRPAAAGKVKDAWLKDALRKRDKGRLTTESTEDTEGKAVKAPRATKRGESAASVTSVASPKTRKKKSSVNSVLSGVKEIKGAVKQPMPHRIQPMLATLVDKPFDGNEWLFEVKFDGYRSIAFIEDDNLRLVSRNQNEMTSDFPELAE
ncbi:MAG: dependent ligase, partial [Candidatus Angelobacter sp.]|nr:dependent ligase [Candidatus Angelobacter sp.]